MHLNNPSNGYQRRPYFYGKAGRIKPIEEQDTHIKYRVTTTPNSFGSRICCPQGNVFGGISAELQRQRQYNKIMCRRSPRSIQAFFLGPRGQNGDYFKKLVKHAINSHNTARVDYVHQDYSHTKKTTKQEATFLDAQDSMEKSFNYICTKLRDLSLPFYSTRYYGHMNWETTIPSILGNFAAMLYNPNNCSFEGGPFTLQLEIECMVEFAKMFDYPEMFVGSFEDGPRSWGHFTGGGTVANCESFWAARNCKYLVFSLRLYIIKEFRHDIGNDADVSENITNVRNIKVNLPDGKSKKLLQLSVWEILNVSNDETMRLYDEIFHTVYDNINKYGEFQQKVSKYTIGKIGIANIYARLNQMNQINPDPLWEDDLVPSPKGFVSATVHYSIPKTISVLGFGEQCMEYVHVDLNTRVDTIALEEKLNECVEKHIPVLAVVGVAGSTEESTVDDLQEILAIKQRMAKKGLFFHFHIDGAHGAYFVSMLREVQKGQMDSLSDYVKSQLSQFKYADSITFDPHKTGYVPYSCGGIFYRNHLLKNNLTFSAPYIITGSEPNLAIYGLEGSKPGSAVTSVYMSLATLPLERSGHGELLERSLKNTKIFCASLYGLESRVYRHVLTDGSECEQNFKSLLLCKNYCDKFNAPEEKSQMIEAYQKIATATQLQLDKLFPENSPQRKYYKELGPDLNIVCYCINFQGPDGCWNSSLTKLNEFNRKLVQLSKPVGSDMSVRMKSLYVSETDIGMKYGQDCLDDFLSRHGLVNDFSEESEASIHFIRSSVMNTLIAEPNEETGCPNQIFLRELAEISCEAMHQLGYQMIRP